MKKKCIHIHIFIYIVKWMLLSVISNENLKVNQITEITCN